MDHLSPLFDQFSPKARVFFTGSLCETSAFEASGKLGHLHVLRSGLLKLQSASGDVQILDQPSLLLHPRPLAHRLMPVHTSGSADGAAADLVCATIDLGSGLNNPLVAALPDALLVALGDMPKLNPVLALLFEESEQVASGQKAALDRLTEYLLILLLRHVIDTDSGSIGILAGMKDARLHRAIKAIHEHPEHPWTLEELAETAAMSRARFASRFRETTGTTPLSYLAQWRISIACSMLRKGSRIEFIAGRVGYGSQSAFTRVFSRYMGVSPREWLLAHR